MKLSIIVPVYNAEKYLNTTIANIFEQTFTDFELILIDDGSTDNSGKLCEDWIQKDSRVKVIHQENAGVGEARNTGLEIAQGEYIGFVDNDDLIHPQMYEILLGVAEKENADIVMSKETKHHEDEKICFDKYYKQSISFVYLDIEQRYKGMFSSNNIDAPYVHIWNKVYKRELINKLGLRFQRIAGEDTIFNCKLYGVANKMLLICDEINLYFWVIRGESLSHDLLRGYSLEYPKLFIYLVNEMQKTFPLYAHFAIEKSLKMMLNVRYIYRMTDKKREVYKEVKQYYTELRKPFIRSKDIRLINKIIITVFVNCPFAFTLFKIITDPTMIKWEKEQRKRIKESQL